MIKILNEFGDYSLWSIYDTMEDHYKIELVFNRAIISTINKSKIRIENDCMISDHIKYITEKYNFAFSAFKVIPLE
jgi:hypothetical protein